MRLYRLAQLLETKYSLVSEAVTAPVSQDKIMNAAINDLMNNFRLYVDGASPNNKNPAIAIVAGMGEPHVVKLLDKINVFISKVKGLQPHEIIKALNEILALMYQTQRDKADVNNYINDNFGKLSRHDDKNYRERLKQKFWAHLSIIFSVYQKVAVALQVLAPDVAVHGGGISKQRGEISRDKYVRFTMTPAAQYYGLDSLDVLEKVLADPELKEKLTTLINAIDRGHIPLDGPEVYSAVKQIMDLFKSRQQTNAPFFESNEPLPPTTPPGEEEK